MTALSIADAAEGLAAEVAVRAERAAPARLLLGLVGAPGAGKSTLAAATAEGLGGRGVSSVVLPMDGFHLPPAELVRLGRRERMGAPDTFDVDGFLATLAAIRADGGTVRAPLFDRSVEEPVPDALEVRAEVRVVLVEGNYLLYARDGWGPVRQLLDHVVALRVAEPIRLERLIARHVASGKTVDAARAWAHGPDAANARLIADSIENADPPPARLDLR